MIHLLKLGLLFGVVFLIVLMAWTSTRWIRRRTIAAWFGRGVNDSLTPAEAALLMALHPGAMLALVYFQEHRLGRAKLLDESPITLEWVGSEPSTEFDRSFRGAFDEHGHLWFPGVHRFLDALYRTVNEKMVGFSGRKTVLYYERMAAELFKQMLAGGRPEPAVYPWLLLLDGSDIWDQMGGGGEWKELKAMHRVKEHLRSGVYAFDEMIEVARDSREGFFRYRNDLGRPTYWKTPTWVGEREGYR